MKHIVAMRFMTIEDGHDSDTDVKTAELCADLFGKYTLKSLLNMENKGFDVVFLLRNTGNLSYIGPLMEYAVQVDASFMRYHDFTNFIERYRGKEDLVVSRCDSDDLYAKWVVDDVQNKAMMHERPFVFGYNRSLLYRIGKDKMRLHEKTYSKGHWSAFQSLVYGKDVRLTGITPYSWKHYDFFEILSKNGYSLNELRRMRVESDHAGFPYVWVRSGNNVSGDKEADDVKYQECNSITKEYVLDNFGVSLPIT